MSITELRFDAGKLERFETWESGLEARPKSCEKRLLVIGEPGKDRLAS
jgi:hypothetical protein